MIRFRKMSLLLLCPAVLYKMPISVLTICLDLVVSMAFNSEIVLLD